MIAEIFVLRYNKSAKYEKGDFEMRKFDHNGLLLAEYQGKLFEASTELNCSTGVYIRIGSTTRQATNSEIRKMIKDSMGYMFEEEISKNQDLHFIRLSRYFESKNIEFNETKYQTLNIKNKEGQFTNFGLLVSDENVMNS